MKEKLGRTVALMGLSAELVSCALILGEGGKFDEEGTGGGKTTSGESTAASISGAPGDTGSTTASDVASGPSGPTTATSSTSTSTSGPTTTSSSSSSGGGGTTCPLGSVDILADDFNDSKHTFSLWTASNPANAKVADHALTLSSPIEFYTTKYYSIINCQISVKLTGLAGSSPTARLNLKNSAGATPVQIFVEGSAGGYISFTPENPITNCPFDMATQAYWRFRATSSELFIETSSNGDNWTDEPCGADHGQGKFSLSQLGLTDGKVQVHLSAGNGLATFYHINK